MNIAHAPALLRKPSKTKNPFFLPDNSYLSAIFENSTSPDPSMHSLGYIRMTSRKGLSCFEGEFSDILFSLHPNDDERYIIYPPEHENGYFDVSTLSQILRQKGKAVEVVRVPSNISSDTASIIGGERTLDTDLDYIYPVHVIDTSILSEMSGGKFLKFRNKVKAAKKDGTTVRNTFFSAEDIASIKEVSVKWAKKLFGNDFESQIEYIDFTLNNLTSLPNMKGLISFQNGTINGFTIWEEPQEGYNTANSLIHCSLHQRGVSELLHHEMTKTLKQRGITHLSLGGAETKGLDAFKRKMQPVRSIELGTIAVT